MSRARVLALALLATCSSHPNPTAPPPTTIAPTHDAATTTMPQPDAPDPPDAPDLHTAIRNDSIQYATMRPPNATLPTRDRIVVVVAPPDAVTLAKRGDLALLDQLVALLSDPERAWAAEVMLAALTGYESDLVNDFQGTPDSFLGNLGKTASQRWLAWLGRTRDKLRWDASRNQFVPK